MAFDKVRRGTQPSPDPLKRYHVNVYRDDLDVLRRADVNVAGMVRQIVNIMAETIRQGSHN